MKLLSGSTSVLSKDGLRYRYKAPSAMFGSAVSSNPALSCYWCGKHHPASELQFERIAGKQQRVCRQPCRHEQQTVVSQSR